MTTKTLGVAAISNGTVIDHIFQGYGLKIAKLLQMTSHHESLLLGINLPSTRFEKKDIIKIEGRKLKKEEAGIIALFSKEATVSLIDGFEVTEKFKVELPKEVYGIIHCPNPNCISQFEAVESHIHLLSQYRPTKMICHFCRHSFEHGDLL